MDRTLVGHVRWNVHATGMWKPPVGPGTDDEYTEDEKGEEEVSSSTLWMPICVLFAVGGTRPQEGAKCAH